MKAARIYGKGDVRVDEVPDPDVGSGQVMLTGGYAGICGTDLHLFHTPESFPWDFAAPAPLTGASWPVILGHEFSGEVSEVAPDVTRVRVGDRVAVFPYHVCGECPRCTAGDSMSCWNIAFDGIQGRTGGLSQKRVVSAEHCFVLPVDVDLRLGALVEPMAVAWRGVRQAAVAPGDAVLILGGGPIGLGVYFALKAAGIARVLVSEPSERRRSTLDHCGIDHVLDPTTVDVPAEVYRLTVGTGVAAVLDCAGSPYAFGDGVQALGVDGRMVVLATYEKPVVLNPNIFAGRKTVTHSAVYTREDFAAVIDAMARGVYTLGSGSSGWVDIVGLDDVVTSLAALREGRAMKVLVSV